MGVREIGQLCVLKAPRGSVRYPHSVSELCFLHSGGVVYTPNTPTPAHPIYTSPLPSEYPMVWTPAQLSVPGTILRAYFPGTWPGWAACTAPHYWCANSTCSLQTPAQVSKVHKRGRAGGRVRPCSRHSLLKGGGAADGDPAHQAMCHPPRFVPLFLPSFLKAAGSRLRDSHTPRLSQDKVTLDLARALLSREKVLTKAVINLAQQ